VIKKLVSLSEDVANQLSQEPTGQQSALVEALLRQHYDLPTDAEDRVSARRVSIIDRLNGKDEFVGSVLSDEDPPESELAEPAITELDDEIVLDENDELKVYQMGDERPATPVEEPNPVDVGSTICPTCGNTFIPPTCLNCL
jgi:hypothetical protein